MNSLARQRGYFDLLSLSIGTTLAIMAATAGLWAKREEILAQNQSAQGGVVKYIGESVNSKYLSLYYSKLVSGTAIPGVANIYRPTIPELIALNVVDGGTLATSAYGFPYAVTLDRTPAGCVAPNCDVTGQVYIAGQITDPSTGRFISLADGAAAIGGDGGYSDATTPAAISGNSGMWSLPNPMGSAPGVLSMRVGYGSSGWAAFVRRDGSLPMEGTLNFKGTDGTLHDIDNVNAVNATSVNSTTVTASGAITGQTVTSSGRISTGEYVKIGGIGVEGQPCDARTVSLDANGLTLSCQSGIWKRAVKNPNLYRYTFTTSQAWTVPAGVSSAFVTMAGGGAGGVQNRDNGPFVPTAMISGASGGFVMNFPVNLQPGESVIITVGTGGPAGDYPHGAAAGGSSFGSYLSCQGATPAATMSEAWANIGSCTDRTGAPVGSAIYGQYVMSTGGIVVGGQTPLAYGSGGLSQRCEGCAGPNPTRAAQGANGVVIVDVLY